MALISNHPVKSDREVLTDVREWIMEQMKNAKLPSSQIMLWELTHLVDGVPVPKLPERNEK